MFASKFFSARFILSSFALLLLPFVASASHIFGIDLYYTHVTGNTYTIYLVVYGDCSGAAFGSLSTATPQIDIYNGATSVSSINLTVQAPATGTEVTPVCPADVANTTCVNPAGTIPGVKRFVYSGNYTVSGLSAVWRFIFEGNMGGTSSAGRSNSITNIVVGGAGSVIQLTDTLNNTTYNNSSAVYTTIATPFYCINQPANFNPGAVDPDGDSLRYNLVPGIDASSGSSVTYISPYTAAAPIGTATGTFSFSNVTGQLSFTPNIVQKALVVYNVEEYHSGVLRGTTQREMTVVVLGTCTSSPPDGAVSDATAGAVVGGTELNICNNVGAFSFEINPTDSDGSDITMTVSGLPAGATFNIVNNGTAAPLGTFAWNTTGVSPGSYSFYITYVDNSCPLSSKQTVAYTVVVYPVPTESVSIISPATCLAKAVFHVTPAGSYSPYTIDVIESGATLHSFTGIIGTVTDSLAAGSYIIRTYNPDGCYVDTTITITAPLPPTPAITTIAPLCTGGSTGTATITGTGGVTPYTYAIGSGSYASSNTFTGLSAGNYTLYIRDANGCVKDTVITVPPATPTLVNVYITSPLCNSQANGSVTLSAYNSAGPYTYAYGSGAYSVDSVFTGFTAGSYTFHVKNANGCMFDTSLTLTDSLHLDATFSFANILCHGDSGTVIVYGTGSSVISYTYAYNASAFGSSDTFSLSAGIYTIHVRDANSCYFDTSITLTQPPVATVSSSVINVSCNGGDNGSVSVSATGGTPTYTFDISGGAFVSSGSFGPLVAGTYTVEVQDANGCIYPGTVTVTQPSAIVIDSISVHMPSCNGGTNGFVHIYATGGTPTYTYAAGSGSYAASAIITGLSAGANTFYIKDANGCIKDTTIAIAQPPVIVPHAFVRSSACSTLANGEITLIGSGGTPGYTYAIGTGSYAASGIFSLLAAGTYTFSVKDANGCIADTVVSVTDSLHISATFSITPTQCYDGATGVIIANGIGGTSPYTYAIGTGGYSATNTYTGLSSTNYNIHIKDNNGCMDDTSVYIPQPSAIAPHITITPPTCNGYNNGSLSVSSTGGTPAYTYALDNSPFSATTTYTSLSAGIDTIRVKDANGCVHDTVFTISQPTALTIAAIATSNVSCYGGSNGVVTLTATGATPPYFYQANSGTWQNSNVLTGLIAGAQTISIKDNNGCTTDTTITLTQPLPLVISSIDTVDPTCQGYKNGSVIINMLGGSAPYQYSFDNVIFSSANSFTALGQGTYTFYIKDTNGCSIDTTITFTGYPDILISLAIATSATCYGAGDGTASVYARGGVQPLAYQLNGSNITSDTATFTGLYSNSYNIIVTDSKNCTTDTAVFVPQPAVLNISLTVTPNSCEGTPDAGAVLANVTGGTAPYKYAWSSDSTSIINSTKNVNNVSGLINALYYVAVTDSNNCQATDTGLVDFNCCVPVIPNAFTPNGDGRNDIFRILHRGDMQVLEFSVYNRFGQRVFYTENEANGWDGTYNGVAADLGTYFYFAKVICGSSSGKVTILKGDVTLIR